MELLENNRQRDTKATPKIEKICILNIYREYLLSLQSNASGSFFQTYINFVEQLKCSHFEGSIIPQFHSWTENNFWLSLIAFSKSNTIRTDEFKLSRGAGE